MNRPFDRGRSALVSITLLLILSTAPAPSARSEEISVKYDFSDPEIRYAGGGFSQLIFPGTIQAGKTGEPGYPFFGVTVLIPRDEEIDSVQFRKSGWKRLPGRIRLFPKQDPHPGFRHSAESATGADRTGLRISGEAYAVDEWIHPPDSGLRIHYLRGHPVATGTFTPVSFRPAAGEAGYYSCIELVIRTIPSTERAGQSRMLRNDPSTIDRLRDIIDNPGSLPLPDIQAEASRRLSTSTGDEYDYMIVTRAAYESILGELKEFYDRRGIRTRIHTVEEIETTYAGADTQEKIREAVIDQYLSCGIDFLLLAGDGDPAGLATVPYRGFYATVQSSSLYEDDGIPSDLYYAALDGSWNDDGDSLWGEEGEDDLYSEIDVGRIPFDSPDEAANFVEKTIAYQQSPVVSDARSALMLGEHLWSDPLTYGGNELDQLIGHCEAYGFTTDGIPPDFDLTRYYDRDIGSWIKSDVWSQVNAGTGWISHAGHTSTLYAMRMSYSDVTTANFTNDGVSAGYPIVYTYGCYAGSFDFDDCIAERMVSIETFAAAVICNSRYGWFTEGTTNGPSHHFQREFFDAVFTEGYTSLGSGNRRSKDETVPFVDLPDEYEPGAHRWVFYCLNLLGDPVLDAWTDTPSPLSVTHASSIERSDTLFAVETDDAGSRAALYWDGVCYGSSISDPAGRISIYLTQQAGDGIDSLVLTVTAHDHLPYVDTIGVVETAPAVHPAPAVSLEQNMPNPFNPSTTIRFHLAVRTDVSLRIYDAAGREVSCLLDRHMDSGPHSVTWQPASLSSGVYFYVLRAGDMTISRKAVLLR